MHLLNVSTSNSRQPCRNFRVEVFFFFMGSHFCFDLFKNRSQINASLILIKTLYVVQLSSKVVLLYMSLLKSNDRDGFTQYFNHHNLKLTNQKLLFHVVSCRHNFVMHWIKITWLRTCFKKTCTIRILLRW